MSFTQREEHIPLGSTDVYADAAYRLRTFDVLDEGAEFGNGGHERKGLTDDQEDAPKVKGSRGGRNRMQ